MASYEMIREILNECPNNQMRDVFIQEVFTSDPERYVQQMVPDKNAEIQRENLADGGVILYVNSAGLLQKFTFTPYD